MDKKIKMAIAEDIRKSQVKILLIKTYLDDMYRTNEAILLTLLESEKDNK